MQNWNHFLLETKKDRIKNLKYGELSKKKHKDRLVEDPKIIDITLSQIPIIDHPENNSRETRQELGRILVAMSNIPKEEKEELNRADKDPESFFIEYMKDQNLDYDKKFIKELYRDVSRVAIKLKVRYNRPRPEQLGPLLGYDVRALKTDTDNSPSFPSGHTMQAWTLAYYLESQYPDHKKAFYDIAQKIEDSRIARGSHYPSDNREAKRVAKKYLFPNIQPN